MLTTRTGPRGSLEGGAVALSLAVALVAACSSDKPKPVTPMPPPSDAGAPTGEAGPAMDPDAGATATGPVFFTTQDAGSTEPQQPAVGEQALDSAIDLAIQTAAPKVAPNMAKEGQTGRATLKEGEHYNMVVTLAPGRCYTFIAFSPPGNVTELDQKLLGVLLAIEAGKASPPHKSMPGLSVMGKGKDAICPISPVPVPYKVDVIAKKGAGRVGVQVYSRSK
jgi:hypothetical protein